MAKTAKLKKREATIHSRAARRAVSPSIDLDKKLKTTSRDSSSPKSTDVKHHVLATQNAGIQKKAKKGNMKRAQRLRHQKGMERAFDNLEKHEVKVAKSIGKEKKVRDRRKGWDDINSNGTTGKKTKQNAFGALEDDSDKRKEREWVSDEEMDDDANEVQETAAGDAVKGAGRDVEVVIPQSVPLPAEDDELL